MAHYSFLCNGCNQEYEIRCSFAESELAVCPACGAVEKRRLYKPIGISVKDQPCARQQVCPVAGGGCCAAK